MRVCNAPKSHVTVEMRQPSASALSIGTSHIGQTGLFSFVRRARAAGNSPRLKGGILAVIREAEQFAPLWRQAFAMSVHPSQSAGDEESGG